MASPRAGEQAPAKRRRAPSAGGTLGAAEQSSAEQAPAKRSRTPAGTARSDASAGVRGAAEHTSAKQAPAKRSRTSAGALEAAEHTSAKQAPAKRSRTSAGTARSDASAGGTLGAAEHTSAKQVPAKRSRTSAGTARSDACIAAANPASLELARLLEESGYFAREESLSRLATFFTALAFSMALIFLSVLPWEGMRPLVIHFQGFWFRYSVIGDAALFLAACHRMRLCWGTGASLFPGIFACLAFAHALTSWHDPWGIFFSNALIEFLLFAAFLAFLYPYLKTALPRLTRFCCVFFIAALLTVAFCSLFAHLFGILGFTARSLPLRLTAILQAGYFFMLMRWAVLLVSLASVGLYIYLIAARARLDPDLAQIRERVFGD